MFSPSAGPISSRTSPSERKWLPRTSSWATRSRSLAKTRCQPSPDPDHGEQTDRDRLQRKLRAATSARAGAGAAACARVGRRNGDSVEPRLEREIGEILGGGGPIGSPRRGSCASASTP